MDAICWKFALFDLKRQLSVHLLASTPSSIPTSLLSSLSLNAQNTLVHNAVFTGELNTRVDYLARGPYNTRRKKGVGTLGQVGKKGYYILYIRQDNPITVERFREKYKTVWVTIATAVVTKCEMHSGKGQMS